MPSYVFEDDEDTKPKKGFVYEDDTPAPQPKKAASVAPTAKTEKSLFDHYVQMNKDGFGGLIRGAGSIGSTLVAPFDMAKDYMDGKGLSLESNRARRKQIDDGLHDIVGSNPDALLYKGGKFVGEVAGTAGAGGLVANGARAAGAAPSVVQALASNGFRAGAAAPGLAGAATNMGTRMLGGGVSGGVAAGMINPEDAAMGAGIGAALPPGLATLGGSARYLGGVAGSLTQPFTKSGQQKIAGRILNDFGQGGPMAVDGRELVKGSVPTLAEATGNAGIARVQSSLRDLRPNAFVDRERANAAARLASFDDIAGDAGKLDFFRSEREGVGKELYDKALNIVPPAPTPYLKGQVTQLLKRPSINEASRTAQKFALERGEKPYMNGSMRGLHDTKIALDDMISEAVQKGKGGHARALRATQDKLLYVMEELSPAYKEARTTFAAMSKPVDEMKALQGLKLTDAQGNVTLSKVQNAIGNLQMRRGQPGTDAAKSIADEKMQALMAIRDDLLRQSNLSAGKSAGSNTFQNIATDGILTAALPGKLGGLVKGKAGGVVGQVGRLAYSGPNEAIRNNLVDYMLDAQAAKRAMEAASRPTIENAQLRKILEMTNPVLYRGAPLLGGD